MQRLIASLALVATATLTLFPALSYAAEFNPHLIITDADLTSAGTMTATDIQEFLNRHQSGLRTMTFTDIDGSQRTAAQVIARAAELEQINPRYLLVVLQKEQSLVTTKNPTQKQLDWATGYGICDACSMSDPTLQKFRGFPTQVHRAAGIMRYYYDNIDKSWIKRAGQTYQIDSTAVAPQSNATAFLYTYTPHIAGNRNFWKLWNQWFTKMYPDGSLLQAAGEKTVYLIQGGKKRAFTTMSALASRYNPDSILEVTPSDISAYESGTNISLPNYSLVRAPSGWTYLLIDSTKHPIASQAVFKTIGFHPDEVVDVSDTEIAEYINGTFITTASVYPLGAVVQEKKTGSLYYIRNGVRQHIPSMDVVKVNFPKKKIVTLDSKELGKYPLEITPITFKEGTLIAVKGSPFIYVVSNGTRRHIPTDAIFKSLGYQTKNIVYTSEQTLVSLPEGAPLSDVPTTTQVAAQP